MLTRCNNGHDGSGQWATLKHFYFSRYYRTELIHVAVSVSS